MNLKQKLSSRKLWAAIAGLVTGLVMVFGLDESIMSTVAGGVVSIASIMTYIVTEGQIDKAAVSEATKKVQDSIDVVVDVVNSDNT